MHEITWRLFYIVHLFLGIGPALHVLLIYSVSSRYSGRARKLGKENLTGKMQSCSIVSFRMDEADKVVITAFTGMIASERKRNIVNTNLLKLAIMSVIHWVTCYTKVGVRNEFFLKHSALFLVFTRRRGKYISREDTLVSFKCPEKFYASHHKISTGLWNL